jgi:hypothetical protein
MNALSRWLRKIFGKPVSVPTLTDKEVIDRYVNYGLEFGDAVSYIYMGECVGFDKLLDAWEQSEREYSALGFRTCSLDDFIDAGGYGKELTDLGTPRDIDEEPVYHAAYYRATFFKKVGPAIDYGKLLKEGGVQHATYARPSTKHLSRK